MAIKVLDKQPGILSNIGNLASLAGMATGQPWLTALGAGMKATDGLINGSSNNGYNSAEDALGKLKDAITGWKNPASGNITKTAGKAADYANAIIPSAEDEQLIRKWSPYNRPYNIY